MEPKEFFVLAWKVLALVGIMGATSIELFSGAEDKRERVISLLLSSIAQSAIVIWLQQA
jgi:hypothetical protein